MAEHKAACPRHGATARSDGTCMVRGCDHRDLLAALTQSVKAAPTTPPGQAKAHQ